MTWTGDPKSLIQLESCATLITAELVEARKSIIFGAFLDTRRRCV